MLAHLRGPFMSGEIPTGSGSVFHFLDIFALGCGLEALSGLHKGDPIWQVLLWVAGAIAFHVIGTKWESIKKIVGARCVNSAVGCRGAGCVCNWGFGNLCDSIAERSRYLCDAQSLNG